MDNETRIQNCIARITAWYPGVRRSLPWRESPTPYRVWISEIMLQQTRIEAVIPYYERFLNELPSPAALAAVEEDRLLKLWEGLGYYSRARNLKKAAQKILADFGGELPYLTAVASPGDCFAPEYQTECSFTTDEFEEIATGAWQGISLNGSPQQWVTDIERTASGTVSQIVIGNAKTTGDEVRKAFSLRSANFDIVYSQNEFVFTVRGYGHGVGMSQYGAQYMAIQGADYREILYTYYPNTVIAKVE